MSQRALIYGLPVDLLSQAQLPDLCHDWLGRPGASGQIVTLNVNMLMLALKDERLFQTIRDAALVTADGYGIARALRRRDYQTDRVTGLALARQFLASAAREDQSVFCYGGSPGACRKLLEQLPQSFPGLKILAARDGFGIAGSSRMIRDELRAAPPRLLLAGLGTPAQELFLGEILPSLPGTIGIGVGGVLEVLAGMQNPAPRWLQDHGWEWLFRMIQEPRRFNRLPDLMRFWWKEVKEGGGR